MSAISSASTLTEVQSCSPPTSRTRRLSQGQQRRVGLARLALSRKPLWLLDEPTNALDIDGVALFTGLLEAHLRDGGLACVATHLPLMVSATIRELSLGGSAA